MQTCNFLNCCIDIILSVCKQNGKLFIFKTNTLIITNRFCFIEKYCNKIRSTKILFTEEQEFYVKKNTYLNKNIA